MHVNGQLLRLSEESVEISPDWPLETPSSAFAIAIPGAPYKILQY